MFIRDSLTEQSSSSSPTADVHNFSYTPWYFQIQSDDDCEDIDNDKQSSSPSSTTGAHNWDDTPWDFDDRANISIRKYQQKRKHKDNVTCHCYGNDGSANRDIKASDDDGSVNRIIDSDNAKGNQKWTSQMSTGNTDLLAEVVGNPKEHIFDPEQNAVHRSDSNSRNENLPDDEVKDCGPSEEVEDLLQNAREHKEVEDPIREDNEESENDLYAMFWLTINAEITANSNSNNKEMHNQVDRHVEELDELFKNKSQEDEATITINSSSNTKKIQFKIEPMQTEESPQEGINRIDIKKSEDGSEKESPCKTRNGRAPSTDIGKELPGDDDNYIDTDHDSEQPSYHNHRSGKTYSHNEVNMRPSVPNHQTSSKKNRSAVQSKEQTILQRNRYKPIQVKYTTEKQIHGCNNKEADPPYLFYNFRYEQ